MTSFIFIFIKYVLRVPLRMSEVMLRRDDTVGDFEEDTFGVFAIEAAGTEVA